MPLNLPDQLTLADFQHAAQRIRPYTVKTP